MVSLATYQIRLVLARESDNRFDVGIRIRCVGDVSSTQQCNDLRTRKYPCEPDNHGREGRWACVAKREQRRLREASDPFEVEGKLSGSFASSRKVGVFSITVCWSSGGA
jgi:hypothetical protein